jgi:hypothetical protein
VQLARAFWLCRLRDFAREWEKFKMRREKSKKPEKFRKRERLEERQKVEEEYGCVAAMR